MPADAQHIARVVGIGHNFRAIFVVATLLLNLNLYRAQDSMRDDAKKKDR